MEINTIYSGFLPWASTPKAYISQQDTQKHKRSPYVISSIFIYSRSELAKNHFQYNGTYHVFSLEQWLVWICDPLSNQLAKTLSITGKMPTLSYQALIPFRASAFYSGVLMEKAVNFQPTPITTQTVNQWLVSILGFVIVLLLTFVSFIAKDAYKSFQDDRELRNEERLVSALSEQQFRQEISALTIAMNDLSGELKSADKKYATKIEVNTLRGEVSEQGKKIDDMEYTWKLKPFTD